MIDCVERFYGKNMQKSRCYCRIINDKAFQRLLSYLSDGQVIYGGKYDAADRYMQFTLLDNVASDAAIMRDEIFGPLLPVMTFDDIKEVISFVNVRPKPLALYYFGSDDAAKEVLSQTTSGGACIMIRCFMWQMVIFLSVVLAIAVWENIIHIIVLSLLAI